MKKKLDDYQPCYAGVLRALRARDKTLRQAYAEAPVADVRWLVKTALLRASVDESREMALRFAEAVAHLGTDASRAVLVDLRLWAETGVGDVGEIRAAAIAANAADDAADAAAYAAAYAALAAANAADAAIAANAANAAAYAANAANAANAARSVMSIDRICALLDLDPEEML